VIKSRVTTVKQLLWSILVLSSVIKLVFLFSLTTKPSSLAPDENTYAWLSKWIANSQPANEFPYLGETLYLNGRSLILPASILVRFGIHEQYSVRLIAVIYSILSAILIMYFLSKYFPKFGDSLKAERNQVLVVLLFIIFNFLPSRLLWSTVGLRESPNEFWLILALLGVFLFFREDQPRKFLLSVVIFISIVGTFSSRPQVGWVLVVSIMSYAIFKVRKHITFLLITSVVTGLFAGYFATTAFTFVTSDLYVANVSKPVPTKVSTPVPTKVSTPVPTKVSTPVPTKVSTPVPINRGEKNASKLCDGTKSKVEYEGKLYNCVKSGTVTKLERPLNLAEVAIDQVEFLPNMQVLNQAYAATIIERLNCPWEESSKIGKYACLAFRAPYMTLTFLFRPLPFIDTTSLSSIFASAENTLWILMFVLIVYRISRVKKIPFFGELGPSLIFFSLYVLGAGSYEGNMGTAFRHKSLILWIVLLLLFAVFWRGKDEAKEPQGSNSQESAV
jgi:hypothetical protein